MSSSQILFGLCFALLTVVRGEPPSSSYGTPIAAPISSYGTPNYNVNNGGHGDHGDQGGHHDDHGGEPKAYEFGYQVKDDYSGNNYNRKESSDGNQVRGEYRVQLPDGRTQIVTYYADWQTGFHADVRYEGTAQYPEQYNTYQGGYNNNNNNGPSNQYGAPNTGYHNGGSATSSVNINKDYSSSGSNNYNNNNNYNAGYQYNNPNQGNNFDTSYNNNFGNKGRPSYEYGAP